MGEHVETIVIEMHGVRLALRSEFSPLPRYVARHLPHHVVPPDSLKGPGEGVHIEVHVRWHTDAKAPPRPAPPGLDRVGKRLFLGPGELHWTETVRVENLSWCFRLEEEKLGIEADYVYAPRPEKLEANPHYLERKLFSLTSWFVLHPLTWYLEHFRGIYLLHASGVAFDGRGVVVAGLGGTGKTTTAVSLVAHGGRMLSENLLFYGDRSIYSYYEPVRLDTDSVALLQGRPGILQPTDIPDGAKSKHLYHLRRDAIAETAAGVMLLMPRFTAAGGLKRLETDPCAERLLAMNGQTREVNDYDWFASVLNFAWPVPDSLSRRSRTLRRFLEGMECFDLEIDRARGVEPVCRTILQQLNGARRRAEG